jgi:hypothetical protein
MRFEVLMELVVKNPVVPSTQKAEAESYSEVMEQFYHITGIHAVEDSILLSMPCL